MSAPLSGKVFVFEFLVCISETLLWSVPVPQVKLVLCPSAAVLVCRDVDMFGTKNVSLNFFFGGSFVIYKRELQSMLTVEIALICLCLCEDVYLPPFLLVLIL
jgi:hypothetical protein